MREKIIVLAFVMVFGFWDIAVAQLDNLLSPSDQIDPVGGLTLAQLADIALSENAEIQATQKRFNEARGLLKQAGMRPNPKLQLGAGSSSILGEAGDQEWTAGYVHTFELAGKRQKRLGVAGIGVEIALQEVQERRRQVLSELRRTFADLFARAALLVTTERAIEVTKKLHEITLARVQEGEAPALEKGLSQVELSRLELEAAAARSDLNTFASVLRRIAGLKQDATFKGDLVLDSIVEDRDLDTMIRFAKKNRPDLQIARLQRQQAVAEVRLARAEGVTDLEAFVEYSNDRARFDQLGLDERGNLVPIGDSDQVLSGGLSINLPFSNRNQGNVEAAAAKVEAARIRSAFLEKSVEQEVQAAYQRYHVAKRNYEIFRDSITTQSETHLNVIRSSYQAGELRFFDLMNEQKRVLDLRKSFIVITKDYFLASSELSLATASGAMTEEGL